MDLTSLLVCTKAAPAKLYFLSDKSHLAVGLQRCNVWDKHYSEVLCSFWRQPEAAVKGMKAESYTHPIGSTVTLSCHGSQLSIQQVSGFVNALKENKNKVVCFI